MKKEIIELYATATSQLSVLTLRAEALELATVQYSIAEKDFAKWNNRIKHFICRKRKTINSFRSF